MSQSHLSTTGKSPVHVVSQIAVNAGQILMRKFKGPQEVSFKGINDPVTDVDIKVESYIIDRLMIEYPYDGFLAEESDSTPGTSGYTWIIDPLDGTRNYVMGIPFFSLVIALAYRGEVVLGVTYDPVRKEMFHALRDEGSYLNNVPIHIPREKKMGNILLGYDLGGLNQEAYSAIEMILHLLPQLQSTRSFGSAALGLAYISCGRLDIYFHNNLAVWDAASGILLVREAGGVVTDKHNKSGDLIEGAIIAGSPSIHQGFISATNGLPWRA